MTAVNLNRAVRGPVTAVPVVAGKGVRLVADTVNNRYIVEADETVLFDDSDGQSTGTFSETISNFERIKVLYVWNSSTDNKAKYAELQAVAQVFSYLDNGKAGTTYNWFAWGSWEITTTGFSLLNGYQSIGGLSATSPVSAGPKIYKVIGINRVSST